ncbi:hypothetical protein, partial [Clostridium tarantellae]|uniref:hypothetical protein n=1 Tax=Clostridium tarantellae TaxID=39493 RepID=UPI00147883E6
LWTWFKLEDKSYMQYIAKEYNLEQIARLADKKGINFANTALESKVKEFCPTLYNLLKEYALRTRVY